MSVGGPLVFVARLWEILVDVFAVEDSYESYCVGLDLQSDPVFANSDPVIRAVAL